MEAKNVFKVRKFTSFCLLFFFLVLVFSGLVLYLRPEGSIARWVGWSFFGLDKKGWEGIHTIFSLFFIISGIVHLLYNWKALFGRLKLSAHGFWLRKDFLWSLVLALLLVVAGVMRWQPIWKISEWRTLLKKGSRLTTVAQPLPDFEKKDLEEISHFLGIPLHELMRKASLLKLEPLTPAMTLLEAARLNNTTPEALYLLFSNDIPSP